MRRFLAQGRRFRPLQSAKSKGSWILKFQTLGRGVAMANFAYKCKRFGGIRAFPNPSILPGRGDVCLHSFVCARAGTVE